ncbi:hypothetical protein CPB86DRAFT_751668 [Serendipita vermifera]|nr:hypothetical protein CPB86DRAFT_751668 [Serendipita vermifera]
MAGRPSNLTSPERVKQTAIDSFNSYQSFVLTPQDLCWVALVVGALTHSDKYPAESIYKVLQILVREVQNVRPTSWEDILEEIYSTKCAMGSGNETDMRSHLIQHVTNIKDPVQLHQFMTEDCLRAIAPGIVRPGHGVAVLKKSFLGIRLRRCRLAYLKLSEAALQRLHRSFVRWIDGIPDENDFGNDIVENPGYMLIRTSIDHSSHPATDAYARFEFDQHTGNVSGAVENLRRYFDQRFHDGRQPPRQHALNALAHHHFVTGDVEAARLIGAEAIDIARIVSDRLTLINATSLMHRLPPKAPPIFYNDTDGRRARKVMQERERVDSKLDIKVPGKYSVIQVGTSPLDMLFDVRLGVRSGEPLSLLFRKRFEATGCLDVSPSLPLSPLNTQWQIWAIDALLWQLSGISKIADIGDKIVLSNTQKGEDIRLYSICTGARRLFQKAQYTAAFGLLLSYDTWGAMNMTQYSYWSCEIWHLMWDIATRRGQEKFKREYLASRKPSPSQADGWSPGDRSTESIRRMILDASNALRMKNYAHATFIIIEAIHYAELNGYWFLHRTAIPIFAELELQRGKVESARRRLEDILPQIARGEDLEQRALAFSVYAKVLMATDPAKSRAWLSQALYYLKRAEEDYLLLEMHASVQDMLYMQAVIHEALGERSQREIASARLKEVENLENKVRVELDIGMMELWDVVCEVGIAVANGDTFCQ